MSIDLSPYRSVRTAYFVRLDIPDYEVLKFSDFDRPYTIGADTYTDLGSLMAISDTTSELRTNEEEVTITISGLPTGNVSDFLDNPVKGARVEIRRGFFNPVTGQLINIPGNPTLKFQGIVNNFNLTDEWDDATNSSYYVIGLVCTSKAGFLNRRIAGRRTNPADQKKFYPTDVSMDRVTKISNSNFQFGAPTSITRPGTR